MIDLDAIRTRAQHYRDSNHDPRVNTITRYLDARDSANDVPALLDEIERLRAALAAAEAVTA